METPVISIKLKGVKSSGKSRLLAGAMSGTSADGVDVVIAKIEGTGLSMSATVIAFESVTYDESLRRAIFSARSNGSIRLDELASLCRSITLSYAETVRRALKSASILPTDLVAIGAHGQTLFHDPPNSIQWIDPSLLAHETGVSVVSDFRRADLAAGGQGAPLVPFADYCLFRSATHDVITLNIGGIANVTWLPCGGSIDNVVAFDCGPGNCLSDWLCRRFDPSGTGFDLDGQLASKGQSTEALVDAFLCQSYFSKSPPKSTDGPAMISIFEKCWKSIAPDASHADLLATSARITARAIVDSLKLIPMFRESSQPKKLIGAGGGFANRAIVRELQALLDENSIQLTLTIEHKIPTSAREALAFAILAAATMDGVPANLPSATGALKRVVLGSITPAWKPHE